MNIRSNPDKTVPAVTTGPLPSSRKIFASPDAAPELRVPLREIILSEGAGEPNLPVSDGIYMFNFFNPASPMWRELGARDTLAPLDKVYTTSARGFGELDYWCKDGRKYVNLQFITPDNPRTLSPGKTEAIDLHVGETLPGAAKVTLRLRIDALPQPAGLAVKFNGATLENPTTQPPNIDYPVNPELVKRGMNPIEVQLEPTAAANATVMDLLLYVRH